MRRLLRTLVGSSFPLVLIVLIGLGGPSFAQEEADADAVEIEIEEEEEEEEEEGKLSAGTLSGLEFRNLGPALMSGRISDIAVDPEDWGTWYLAAASGGVWKTENAGTTWTPIFDGEDSYAIACVTLDPRNPQTVWVGTGENNSQRSVGYGDGVYKSLDGGRSWENVGLEDSAHIGRIVIDPRDSDVVYVAAQGPLWSPGGERGLYKTVDGGQSWTLILEISENTGITDVLLDPRDPDRVYAASYQRRRHVGMLLGGGPESGFHKSTDGGMTWREVKAGLPGGDLGRIGLAISPQNPDVLYATVEALKGQGFYRSDDRGERWEKRSDYYNSSGQYYAELWPDPHRFDRVFAADTRLHVTEDGGRNFRSVASDFKHVDNHAMAFDPGDPAHMLIGCDGGLYETWDDCETYRWAANLPLTQFYRVGLDNALPFYHVYGGTQDNATQGGPSRTNNRHGIRNSDWYVTVGGDGFQTRVDPEDPNIVYSQWQHAGLIRYDRQSGERVEIQPQPEPGEAALKWHWNSPLIISPHLHTRLYFAAQRLFRSDDRGATWQAISPDLSRGIDRNELEVMGRLWSVDSVNRNESSSFYGTIVSLDESPLVEGLIYVGTDDGLVQVTEDGGATWRKIESFPDVPAVAYSADVVASQHDPDTVFALFENHKRGDFRPYVLKSTDRGVSWNSIAGDLPEDEPTWCLVQDHEQPNLLFVSTEFGVYVTVDGGTAWFRLKGGLPTISVRDMEIQRRENDLVLATFGRGFYVLDDYSPLRRITAELLEEEAVLFDVDDALWYLEASPLGGGEKGSQGDAFFTAPNPPYGAVFTYYLAEGLKSRKAQRKKREKEHLKAEEPIPFPSWDELRAEDREEDPVILVTVTDAEGNVVRRFPGPAGSGLHRVTWDLRYPSLRPARSGGGGGRRGGGGGPLAVPGTYAVSIAKRVDGVVTPLAGPVSFETVPLGLVSLPATDRAAMLAFQEKLGRLQRAIAGTSRSIDEALTEVKLVRRALDDTVGAPESLSAVARDLERRLLDVQEKLAGDRTRSRRQEPTSPSLQGRVSRAMSCFTATSAPTTTQVRAYDLAADQFDGVLEEVRRLVEVELVELEAALERAHAPWTPGRGVPRWTRE